jgi:hypothetical protein
MELQSEWTAATDLEKRDWDEDEFESGGGPIVALAVIGGRLSFVSGNHLFRLL